MSLFQMTYSSQGRDQQRAIAARLAMEAQMALKAIRPTVFKKEEPPNRGKMAFDDTLDRLLTEGTGCAIIPKVSRFASSRRVLFVLATIFL